MKFSKWKEIKKKHEKDESIIKRERANAQMKMKWPNQRNKEKTRMKMKSFLTPKYVVTSKIKDKMSIQSTRCNLRNEVVMRSISKMVKSKRQA